jgi:UDP-glucose 4-epimerase
MESRRILITGLSSYLGGRLAQALESEPGVEALVGIDVEDPRHELQRTEFVRAEIEPGSVRRILRAAAIDTVVDTRLIPDAMLAPPGHVHAVNVTGTANILQACAAAGDRLRKLVFKSSANYYGWGSDQPAFITEDIAAPQRPRTALERGIVQAERAVAEFGARHPDRTVTVLRLADEIGSERRSSHLALLGLPVVPSMLGFDPRFQFVHEDDVVDALAHATLHELRGAYNVAADGVLALSEVVSLLGKTMLPVLPPWGTGLAATSLRRLGLRVPLELTRQLRYGRGLDNRRLKASGVAFRFTSRETVLRLRAQQRLRPLLRSGGEDYHYEPEVEEFLRWSPSVQSAATRAAPAPREDSGRVAAYDELTAAELVEIIPSLESDALEDLHRYETAHQARRTVVAALERALGRQRS